MAVLATVQVVHADKARLDSGVLGNLHLTANKANFKEAQT